MSDLHVIRVNNTDDVAVECLVRTLGHRRVLQGLDRWLDRGAGHWEQYHQFKFANVVFSQAMADQLRASDRTRLLP